MIESGALSAMTDLLRDSVLMTGMLIVYMWTTRLLAATFIQLDPRYT